MFSKVLVANRGAVAARVLRCLNSMNVPSVAVYSDADAGAPYLALASETVRIGEGPAQRSYLDQTAILGAARTTGADAVHPGYGFLSENSAFAQSACDAGVAFIGPSPRWIEAMGHKARARELAEQSGLPVCRGSGVLDTSSDVAEIARNIGFPIMVKPAGGGGGIGMLPVRSEAELAGAVAKASSLALRGFANGDVYLERLLERPRHIEFQVLGDHHGGLRHLFERDCSVQRRNQKIVEEAPAPFLPRPALGALADRVAASLRKLGYDGIGTVEMLMGADGTFTFLEMNTRLQVEHGVTEQVTGLDLVAAQIRCAAGERLAAVLPDDIVIRGHAIEARICAEDPVKFFPSSGTLKTFRFPTGPGIRVDTGYAEGRTVTPFYDSLLAKLIVHAPTRPQAVADLIAALEGTTIEGVKTNIPTILKLLRTESFQNGPFDTGIVADTIH
jgi:acetyl-CoA carboxylase, biotin carboxylase subunit